MKLGLLIEKVILLKTYGFKVQTCASREIHYIIGKQGPEANLIS